MLEFLSTPAAKAVLNVAILLVVMAVAYYVLRRFRDRAVNDHRTTNELITEFREMREEGDITEAEFREIKTVLGEKLQDELKDADDEG